METFDALMFLQNLMVSLFVAWSLGVIGHGLIRPFTKNSNEFLQGGLAISMGMLLFIGVTNALAYAFPPRDVLVGTMGIFLFLGILLGIQRVKRWLKQGKNLSKEFKLVGVALVVLLTVFFTNGLYDVYVFDEVLHRPIISTLLSGNFPIAQEGNPFNLSNHYQYHYGMDLFAAGISAAFQLQNALALDAVATLNLLMTAVFFYGMLRELRLSPRAALVGMIFGLMCGGYLVLAADAGLRAAFYGSNEFSYMYSAYIPLWQGLYVITFVYVPLVMMLLTLTFLILSQKKTTANMLLRGMLVWIIGFSSYALIGESQWVLIPPLLILYFLFDRFIGHPSLRVFNWKNSGALVLAWVITVGIVSVQGGFITGLLKSEDDLVLDYVDQSAIEAHFQIQETSAINDFASSESWVYFNLSKTNNAIYRPSNFFMTLSEVGPYGLFIGPLLIFLIFFVLPAYHKGTYPPKESLLIPLILLMASNLGIPLLFSTGFFEDAYLSKFFLVGTGSFYVVLAYYVLGGRVGLKKGGTVVVLTLLALSIVPNFFLKAYFQQFNDAVYSLEYVDPGNYEVEEWETLKAWSEEIPHDRPTLVLATQEESWAVSDIAGAMTYAYLLVRYDELQEELLTQLRPENLTVLGIDAVWVTPQLREQLSPQGKYNLERYYELWVGDETWGMYRIKAW